VQTLCLDIQNGTNAGAAPLIHEGRGVAALVGEDWLGAMQREECA